MAGRAAEDVRRAGRAVRAHRGAGEDGPGGAVGHSGASSTVCGAPLTRPCPGVQPFRRAMQRHFPGLRLHFASRAHAGSVRALRDTLVGPSGARLAKKGVILTAAWCVLRHGEGAGGERPRGGHAERGQVDAPERAAHVRDPRPCVSDIPSSAPPVLTHGAATPKALRTSAHPGLTRALSTRLKLSLDPPIYAYDSPGVMLPFLGRDARGAERGAKLALIGAFSRAAAARHRADAPLRSCAAGIREGMYDVEALAAYLVYRLWVLNPSGASPAASARFDADAHALRRSARVHGAPRAGRAAPGRRARAPGRPRRAARHAAARRRARRAPRGGVARALVAGGAVRVPRGRGGRGVGLRL